MDRSPTEGFPRRTEGSQVIIRRSGTECLVHGSRRRREKRMRRRNKNKKTSRKTIMERRRQIEK
jgi:hypothetical protein